RIDGKARRHPGGQPAGKPPSHHERSVDVPRQLPRSVLSPRRRCRRLEGAVSAGSPNRRERRERHARIGRTDRGDVLGGRSSMQRKVRRTLDCRRSWLHITSERERGAAACETATAASRPDARSRDRAWLVPRQVEQVVPLGPVWARRKVVARQAVRTPGHVYAGQRRGVGVELVAPVDRVDDLRTGVVSRLAEQPDSGDVLMRCARRVLHVDLCDRVDSQGRLLPVVDLVAQPADTSNGRYKDRAGAGRHPLRLERWACVLQAYGIVSDLAGAGLTPGLRSFRVNTGYRPLQKNRTSNTTAP